MSDFDSLWDYDHPAETEARFRARIHSPESSGDEDTMLQIFTQIARAQGLQKHFDDAHRTLDQVQSRLTPATPLARIRYLLERGRVYNSSGKPTEACVWFKDAYDEASRNKYDSYAIDALHMLAIADTVEHQMDWNREALALAQQSSDPRAANWQGSLYNNIGWTYFDAGEYSQALSSFEEALQCRERQGKVRESLIARWCIARTLRALNQVPEALQMQRDIREAWLTAGEVPDGYGSEEIAECLLALGKSEEARAYFAEAYARFSANGTLADQPERLARIKQLVGQIGW
jgi:tetratricopeptide (TPR) repeat protein